MILMYHKIFPHSSTEWWVEVDQFYRQMWELQSKQVVYLDEYDPANPNHVVITFDGVYKNVLQYAAPILEKFGYPFELFVTSDYLGRDNHFDEPEPSALFANTTELKELESVGGRIQWHTRSHPDMADLHDRAKINYELAIPGELTGAGFTQSSFRWFAYPHGNYNADVLDAVRKQFSGAVTCHQGDDADRYTLNRVTVVNETSFKPATVACIISSYNYGGLLAEALESVLRQTILPDEIVITDDCSQDNTQEVAQDYCARYPNLIRYNRNEENLGVVRNFNRAIALTKSDYIFFLGADNRVRSNYVEECAAVLNADPAVAIAYTDFHLFGPRAGIMYETFPEEYRGRIVGNAFYHIVFPEQADSGAAALEGNNFIHGSSMYRRSAFEAVGGYMEKSNRPEDHDLFYRILKAGHKATKTSRTTLEYRQHSREQANVRLMSYGNLLFYIEKARKLERELQTLERSKWLRTYFRMRKLKGNARKFISAWRIGGPKYAVTRAMDALPFRRGQKHVPQVDPVHR